MLAGFTAPIKTGSSQKSERRHKIRHDRHDFTSLVLAFAALILEVEACLAREGRAERRLLFRIDGTDKMRGVDALAVVRAGCGAAAAVAPAETLL